VRTDAKQKSDLSLMAKMEQRENRLSLSGFRQLVDSFAPAVALTECVLHPTVLLLLALSLTEERGGWVAGCAQSITGICVFSTDH